METNNFNPQEEQQNSSTNSFNMNQDDTMSYNDQSMQGSNFAATDDMDDDLENNDSMYTAPGEEDDLAGDDLEDDDLEDDVLEDDSLEDDTFEDGTLDDDAALEDDDLEDDDLSDLDDLDDETNPDADTDQSVNDADGNGGYGNVPNRAELDS